MSRILLSSLVTVQVGDGGFVFFLTTVELLLVLPLIAVRLASNTLYSHLADSQQRHALNIHASLRALIEKDAADTVFMCSLSVCRWAFYCTARSRKLVRAAPQGAASQRGWSPDSPAAVSLKSDGEMKVISCRRYKFWLFSAPGAKTGNPATLAARSAETGSDNNERITRVLPPVYRYILNRFSNLNHKMICCLHQTNLCSLQSLLGTSSCDAARVSRVLSGTLSFSW